jgi:PAS domain S-box-containing protein
MSLSAYLPAAGKVFDPLAVRQHLAQIAARGLAGFAGAFGVLMLVLSLAEVLMKGSLGGLAGQRLLLGGFIGIGAVGGWLLLRRGWPHWAATVTVVIIASGIAWHGWAIGLGLYTTALAGLCLLVTVAGMLLGMRAALGLTAGYAAVVALLAYAEVAGWVQGRAALGALPLADRVLGHALLGCAGLLGALLLHRMVTSVIAQAVREQQRLAELLTIGIDYSWEMDRRGRLTYLSPSFEATTGHRIAAFMRLAEPGGPQPLANDEYRAFQDDLRAGRAYRDRRITMRATDGSELHVVGNGRPMLDAEGRVERWIGVARNVTREVEAERRQQRTQTMFDRMIAMSPDAICVARAAGQLVLVNAGFEAMSGLPAAALIGRRRSACATPSPSTAWCATSAACSSRAAGVRRGW